MNAVHPKRIGFLSFGHWHPSGPHTRSAADALTQSIELAVAAEELGIDGAYYRVHHFERQLAAPYPLLAAVAARTSRIEIGTGVIDMRYENPLYAAEEASAADLISGGRLQLGISRGTPSPALDGYEAFGYVPAEGSTDTDLAHQHTAVFRAALAGAGVARSDPRTTGRADAVVALSPLSEGLSDRIWWGSGTRSSAVWAAQQGMNLMSSTLLTEDTGVPFDQAQAEQIAQYRTAWAEAGRERTPRVSISRSVIPLVTDEDHAYFGDREHGDDGDQVGYVDHRTLARFGRSYTGEPDVIAEQLANDAAVQAADTVLLTVPNQLGVDYNARLLETIARDVAPAWGWTPATATATG